MSLNYLVGPVTPARAQRWQAHRDQGRCLAFHSATGADVLLAPGDTWDTLLARLPADWRPDFIVLELNYTTVPACLFDAPVPLVALCPDWQLQWHFQRRFLPHCQAVFTDAAGVEVMRRHGIAHAQQANLFGLQDVFTQPAPSVPNRRTIDVLFVGNLQPAVQRHRLRWLGRLARLAERWNVHIAQGVLGEDYRQLLLRSRIVFNRSIRGEWNLRVCEAASCGALVFNEAVNLELPGAWQHGEDCVFYDDDNLESLLEHYLSHEDERARVAEAGRQKAGHYTFAAIWEDVIARVENDWPVIQERFASRPRFDAQAKLVARTWQALGAADGGDPTLAADLRAAVRERPDAVLHNALGLVEPLRRRDGNRRYATESLRSIAGHFHRAATLAPRNPVAARTVIETLVALGQKQLAVEGAKRLLVQLLGEPPTADDLDLPHFPPAYDFFRVEWEAAAANVERDSFRSGPEENGMNSVPRLLPTNVERNSFRSGTEENGMNSVLRLPSEVAAKLALLRWRLHTLLAELTGDIIHRHEAALARPDLPTARAALGCALGAAGRAADAVPHLRFAVENDPFDRPAARALYQALLDAGQPAAAEAFRQERLLLHRAAPTAVPAEGWLTRPFPPASVSQEAERSEERAGRVSDGCPAVAYASGSLSLRTGQESPPTDIPLVVGTPRVSLCIIAKNEEANLGPCLDSAAGLCDEIIVVDTGSTDRTRQIAREKGARVFEFPWIDHFAAARNSCLEHATGDWIFWLDADDRIDADNRDKLRRVFASLPPGNVAYSMKCRCLPDPVTGTVTTVDHIRLFRNHPRIRWRYRVHEQILGSVRDSGGQVLWADVVIQHTGYTDAALRRRKLARDLRLLEMERQDQPHDPFTLFNLGASYAELGRYDDALPLLQESLERSHPRDSIVRKLYALIANCHLHRGRIDEALHACLKGQAVCPDDEELLFLEGLLRTEKGDYHGARIPLVRLLGTQSEQHFASLAYGLRGYKGRHQLAVVCCRLGETREAEELWRAVVRDRPDYLLARIGLGELYLAQEHWAELEEQATALEKLPNGHLEAVLLLGKMRMARGESGLARTLLEEALAREPDCVPLLVTLSHVLLREDRDHAAAERVLQEILSRDPTHAQARQNLNLLRQAHG